MKNRRALVFGIVGMITILVTIIVFALTGKDNANTSVYLGFGFVLLSEILLWGGLSAIEFFSNRSSEILSRTGIGSILITYCVTVFIVSMVYMLLNTEAVIVFLVFQLILFAVAAILAIVFGTISKTVKEKDSQVLVVSERIASMVNCMEVLGENPRYGKQIKKLAEELKYTDVSSAASVDEEIEGTLAKIEMSLVKNPYADEVDGFINDVAILIKKRNFQVRAGKTGGM